MQYEIAIIVNLWLAIQLTLCVFSVFFCEESVDWLMLGSVFLSESQWYNFKISVHLAQNKNMYKHLLSHKVMNIMKVFKHTSSTCRLINVMDCKLIPEIAYKTEQLSKRTRTVMNKNTNSYQ